MHIYLKDYLEVVENNDYTLAIAEALRECKKHKNATLHLCGGEINFYKKYSTKKYYYISNNTFGLKNIIFPIIGFDGLTIDGENADLLFHGKVLPFVIDESKNITIKNLSIDYPHPFFFQGRITDAGNNFAEIEYDEDMISVDILNGKLRFYNTEDNWEYIKDKVLVTEFEFDTKAPSDSIPPYFIDLRNEKDTSFLSGMSRYLTVNKIGNNKLRFDGEYGFCHKKGNMLVCTFPGRENPGIFSNESENIKIENVNLYSTGAMGIICQLCINIDLINVKTIVRENSNRFLSVNADSTHFVNCEGLVHYENCVFLNMLDDAGNVHGNYHPIKKKLNDNTLLLGFGHPEQKGVNPYRKDDKVHIVNNMTMENIATLTVKNSNLLSEDYITVEFAENVPEITVGFVCEDFTRMPELIINNCVSGNNRPRGFLPGTWKKTIITNNTFYNMMYALHFTGDCNDWFESSYVKDVLIKGNYFKNSAYTGGTVIMINPHILRGNYLYHSNIKIEDNTFELHEKRFLYAEYTDNLEIKNNKYMENKLLPSHPCFDKESNGISVAENCKNANIENVKEENAE